MCLYVRYAWDLPSCVVDMSSDSPFEEAGFVSQHVPIMNIFLVRGRKDFVSTFPSQCWDVVWFEPTQALCALSPAL